MLAGRFSAFVIARANHLYLTMYAVSCGVGAHLIQFLSLLQDPKRRRAVIEWLDLLRFSVSVPAFRQIYTRRITVSFAEDS